MTPCDMYDGQKDKVLRESLMMGGWGWPGWDQGSRQCSLRRWNLIWALQDVQELVRWVAGKVFHVEGAQCRGHEPGTQCTSGVRCPGWSWRGKALIKPGRFCRRCHVFCVESKMQLEVSEGFCKPLVITSRRQALIVYFIYWHQKKYTEKDQDWLLLPLCLKYVKYQAKVKSNTSKRKIFT